MDELNAQRLRSLIPVLVEQRDIVISMGACLAGHLIDLAIMQLRLTVNDISDVELAIFSDLLSVRMATGDHSD
jgi:hypothetical protein